VLLSSALLVTPVGRAQQTLAGEPVSKPTPGFASAHIGGRLLRYRCAGSGTPTVLVEQGMAISMETTFSWSKPVGWAVILPTIASVTRMCVYDRAGLGLSSKKVVPATSLDAAQDLHSLLGVLGITPPYVLAGQSLGGMDALAFAGAYPDSVAGMILIDSSHPDQQRRFEQVLPPRQPDESDVLRGFRDGPRDPLMGEWFDFRRNSEQMRVLPDLGDKPLIVLTRDPALKPLDGPVPVKWEELTEPVWQQLQTELARLSKRSRHVVVSHAGHNIQFEQPQVVADAILDVLHVARTGGSLATHREQ
jgi:pimeloyl-ACP methyl ester carboxylesterase